MADSTTPTPPVFSKPARPRRRLRHALMVTAITLAGAWLLLTHSPLTRALVVPRLENLIGADVYGGSASVGLDGTVTLRNVSIRVPSIEGPAGAVFQVKRLRAWLNWRRALGRSGPEEPLVAHVEMHEPIVRFSQSVEEGTINIGGLTIPSGRSGPAVLPPVTVRNGVLELGEHHSSGAEAGSYTPLRRLSIDGQITPVRDDNGVYNFTVNQLGTPGASPERLFDLYGRFGEKDVSLTMRRLSLDDWHSATIPTRLRGIFADMDLRGSVERLTFDYDEDAGVRASMALKGVAVNLPVSGEEVPLEGPVAPQPLMRMQNVAGEIRFDSEGFSASLDGLLEDLPYHVVVNYSGTTADAQFTCTLDCRDFKMEEKPQILRFAPALVKYRLAQFSNPTATVTTHAEVRRGPPVNGVAADVKVSGTLTFENGVAAYETFPYRFQNLHGKVRFDDQSIEILSLEGDAPGGATVRATAKIGPLTDAAAADIRVECRNIPIDDTLEKAMGPQRRRFVNEIASKHQYQRLADDGVVLPPDKAASLRDQLAKARDALPLAPQADRGAAQALVADLERRLAAPPFALGGVGDVSVRIEREAGYESIWTEIIEVRLGAIGLVPDRFPLPLVADGVRIVIDGETIKVSGGHYRGLEGGTAAVSATMRYPSTDHPDIDPMPQVEVTAKDIPTDERFVAAIGGAVARVASGPAAPSPGAGRAPSETEQWTRQVLGDLGLKGAFDATARISSAETGTSIQADATTQGLSCTPRPASAGAAGPAGPVLDRVAGAVHLADQRLALDFSGRAYARDQAGNVRVRAVLNIGSQDPDLVGPPAPTAWTAVVGAPALDAADPVEDMVRVFSPTAADHLTDLRATYRPSGRIDALTVLAGGGPVGNSTSVEISNADGFEFDALGGRARAVSSRGLARVESSSATENVTVSFDALTAPLLVDGAPAGTLRTDGLWQSDAHDATAPGSGLDLRLTDGAFESALTYHLVVEHGGTGLRDLVDRLHPTGVYDCRLRLERTGAASGEPNAWAVHGTLEPKSLGLTFDGVPARFHAVSGTVEFDAESGSAHLRADAAPEVPTSDGWTIAADGSWIVPAPGTIALQTDLAIDTTSLPRALLAVLPSELTDALRELDFKIDGRLTIPKATIRFNDDGTPEGRAVRAEGTVTLDGASFEAGVPASSCRGSLQFNADRRAGQSARYTLLGMLDSFRLSGIAMTDGRFRIDGGQELGPAIVPLISADCYGGRLAGRMKLAGRPDGRREFQTEFQLSGVRFAPVLRDLTGVGPPPARAPADDKGGGPPAPTLDESRGVMDAAVTLTGLVGLPESRRGRGSATIGDGAVLDLPLLLPLVQFSNLQLPTDERLEQARGAFYIDGQVIAFEELSIGSKNVKLYGYGTVGWPDLNLDMRFNSRAQHPVPILSGILEGLRDEFISTVVSGTVKDPKISTVPLAGTGQLLDRLFGSSPTDEQRRMDEIQLHSRRARSRVRTEGWQTEPVPQAPDR